MEHVNSAYVYRDYRNLVDPKGLEKYRVVVGESDLLIMTHGKFSEVAQNEVIRLRRRLKEYIAQHPEFQVSLVPVPVSHDSPALIRRMADAGRATGVGPMAAVAGAISECVGKVLLNHSSEVIVENGGDIYMVSAVSRRISIFAGISPLSRKVGLRIRPESTPCGVCTSSGTVGHSKSFGLADAVVAVAGNAALADAAATAIGNRVRSVEDVESAVKSGESIPGLGGVVVIKDNVLGAWGDIELVDVEGG